MCVRLLIFSVCLLASACIHAPRKNLFPPKSPSDELPVARSGPSSVVRPHTPRFVDTSYVTIAKGGGTSLQTMFDNAMSDYDDAQYDLAEKQFQFLAETLDESDSLGMESRFMICESRIQLNSLDQAAQRLTALLSSKNSSASIVERSLLRLGQVYCAQEKKDEAKKTFKQFVTQFPKSVYRNLASCESLQK